MWTIKAWSRIAQFRVPSGKEARRDRFPFGCCVAKSVSGVRGLRGQWRGAGAGRRDAPDYVLFQRLDGLWRGVLSNALRKGDCLIEGGKGTSPEGGGLRVFHSNTLLEPL